MICSGWWRWHNCEPICNSGLLINRVYNGFKQMQTVLSGRLNIRCGGWERNILSERWITTHSPQNLTHGIKWSKWRGSSRRRNSSRSGRKGEYRAGLGGILAQVVLIQSLERAGFDFKDEHVQISCDGESALFTSLKTDTEYFSTQNKCYDLKYLGLLQ